MNAGLVVFVALFSVACGIRCFQCNTNQHAGCDDTFEEWYSEDKGYIVDCDSPQNQNRAHSFTNEVINRNGTVIARFAVDPQTEAESKDSTKMPGHSKKHTYFCRKTKLYLFEYGKEQEVRVYRDCAINWRSGRDNHSCYMTTTEQWYSETCQCEASECNAASTLSGMGGIGGALLATAVALGLTRRG